MFSFFKKPQRPVIDNITCGRLMKAALAGKTLPVFKYYNTKETMACPTPDDVVNADIKAFLPWEEGIWECENQANALVHQLQLMARSRRQTYAAGVLRADDPSRRPGRLHVFVWAVCTTPKGREVLIFDPTARQWFDIKRLTGVDYANV